MRIVFFGSSEFAIPSLRALAESGREPELVVTQPDAARGRGRAHEPSPLGRTALDLGLEVLRPEKVNEAGTAIAARRPDIFVVMAYGQKLGPALLSIPPLGAYNIHGSLLPRYRGAAPIQRAILNGEVQTGITLLEVVEQMDAGDIVAQRVTAIAPEETAGELHDRLAVMGAELLVELLPEIEAGRAPRRPQEPSQVTWARRLGKEEGHLSFDQTVARIVNHVRAMTPWPGAYCFVSGGGRLAGTRLIVLEARVDTGDAAPASGIPAPLTRRVVQAPPGTIVAARDPLVVVARDGLVAITRIMREGKKPLGTAAFLRGFPLNPGDRLE
ncbi:MAG: methionyl-tRNA formyltransferase [Planctomycetota bacterium]